MPRTAENYRKLKTEKVAMEVSCGSLILTGGAVIDVTISKHLIEHF